MYSKKLENELLSRWESLAVQNNDNNFTYDGLLFRGTPEQDDKKNWFYKEGDEEAMWNSSHGILFITLDVNGTAGENIRTWTGRQNGQDKPVIANSNEHQTFFPNLMRWSFGLREILSGRDPLSFDSVSDEMAISAFDTMPIARINIKKEAGKSNCPSALINQYFSKPGYFGLLKEQIELFSRASIIYCGGKDTFRIVRKLFKPTYINDTENYTFIAEIDGYNTLLVNGCHPAYPGRNSDTVSCQDEYEHIMRNVGRAFELHPELLTK